MAHPHGMAHLVRRQRRVSDDSGVATVTSVKIVTAQNTNTGKVVWVTQSLIPAMVRSRPWDEEDSSEVTPLPVSSSKRSSQASQASPTPVRTASTLMLATHAPSPDVASTSEIPSITAAVASASSAAAASGMTTGAKAGLTLGALVIVGALLVGVLLVYRRKKKQAAGDKETEKIDLYDAPPPPPPQLEAAPLPAPSIRSERTTSAAPRLSLRPVTQFDPAFHEQAQRHCQSASKCLGAPWRRCCSCRQPVQRPQPTSRQSFRKQRRHSRVASPRISIALCRAQQRLCQSSQGHCRC